MMAELFRGKDAEDVEEAARMYETIARDFRDSGMNAEERSAFTDLQRKRAARLRNLAERIRAAVEGGGQSD